MKIQYDEEASQRGDMVISSARGGSIQHVSYIPLSCFQEDGGLWTNGNKKITDKKWRITIEIMEDKKPDGDKEAENV